MPHHKFYIGHTLEVAKQLPPESVQTIVTSPPYWGLRDYGNPEQLGLEPTPEEYVNNLVEIFREYKRVLADDGTLWLNLGDSYVTQHSTGTRDKDKGWKHGKISRDLQGRAGGVGNGRKPKDIAGIPWLVAFALQQDGWYLRQDIIWCLSGGTWVYAKTQKGEKPMMVKDLARLDPKTVKLWNGKKWTQVLGYSCSERKGNELELVLRSGERISCTPEHQFPTNRGLLRAKELQNGDVIEKCTLPEPSNPKKPKHIGYYAGWFVGMYLAEGSMSDDAIQIAGHKDEQERLADLRHVAESYGGYCVEHTYGNNQVIVLHGNMLHALLKTFLTGNNAKNKGLKPECWKYGNTFLKGILNGYLDGDGHFDLENNRWRIAFTRNYKLEQALRTICARLGYKITLKPTQVKFNGKQYKVFKGEIRETKSNYHSSKAETEIVEIRKSRCRYVYDIGVADEPHLFSLASGVLTHNSKPNPMPESVTDRCTKAHEYIFLLTKSSKYYYDAEAVKEPANYAGQDRGKSRNISVAGMTEMDNKQYDFRNKRTVWTVSTKPYKEAHFAVFPPDLIEPCILAGSRKGDTALDPFGGSGTTTEVCMKLGRNSIYVDLSKEYLDIALKRTGFDKETLVNVNTHEIINLKKEG